MSKEKPIEIDDSFIVNPKFDINGKLKKPPQPSSNETPLKYVVFRRNEDGSYTKEEESNNVK